MRKDHSGLILLGSLLAFLVFLSCKEAPLKSEWKSAGIASDNPDTAWANTSTYAWEDQNILLGLQNDAAHLRILLRARDRATQATIMRAGLTIWLDPTGNDNRTFGIHYPIGRQDTAKTGPTNTRSEDRRALLGPQTTPMPDTMEIIEGEKRETVPIENNLGVSIWTSNSYGTITYLLSVPLKASSDSTFGIKAAAGDIISIGFETGAQNFASANQDRERFGEAGEPSDTAFGGNPGEWSERGQSMPRRPRPGRRIEPIKFWTRVTLATGK